jgi:hypothetical protein
MSRTVADSLTDQRKGRVARLLQDRGLAHEVIGCAGDDQKMASPKRHGGENGNIGDVVAACAEYDIDKVEE